MELLKKYFSSPTTDTVVSKYNFRVDMFSRIYPPFAPSLKIKYVFEKFICTCITGHSHENYDKNRSFKFDFFPNDFQGDFTR